MHGVARVEVDVDVWQGCHLLMRMKYEQLGCWQLGKMRSVHRRAIALAHAFHKVLVGKLQTRVVCNYHRAPAVDSCLRQQF